MISLKNFSSVLFIVTALLVVGACKKDKEFSLTVLTENYPPFNYLDNGELKGSSADLVYRIMSDLGEAGTIEVLQWDAAYARLLNESDVALFTADRTPERTALFKWAGPIARIDYAFFALATSSLVIDNLDAAKAVNGIAVVNGYSAQEMLESYGFQNLIICQNLEEVLQKLLNNEVDLIIESRHAAQLALQNMGHTFSEVKNMYVLLSYLSYIAFNKSVPNDVVEKWQNQIDILKDNGTLKQLYQKYIPGDIAPGKLQIFTEEDPPMNYACRNNDLCGSSIEIVNEIKCRTGWCQDPVKLENWTNAYNMALINPNTVLFSMSRTEARENLFEWVGPICRNISCFYVKSNSGISINSFDEAKSLAGIAVVSGWYMEQMLADSGFTNLQSFSTPLEVLMKLMEGDVEAAVLSDISIQYLTESAGYTPDDVSAQFDLTTAYLYIAFGKNSRSDYIGTWTSALAQMKQDETFETIWNKWYPGLPLP